MYASLATRDFYLKLLFFFLFIYLFLFFFWGRKWTVACKQISRHQSRNSGRRMDLLILAQKWTAFHVNIFVPSLSLFTTCWMHFKWYGNLQHGVFEKHSLNIISVWNAKSFRVMHKERGGGHEPLRVLRPLLPKNPIRIVFISVLGIVQSEKAWNEPH